MLSRLDTAKYRDTTLEKILKFSIERVSPTTSYEYRRVNGIIYLTINSVSRRSNDARISAAMWNSWKLPKLSQLLFSISVKWTKISKKSNSFWEKYQKGIQKLFAIKFSKILLKFWTKFRKYYSQIFHLFEDCPLYIAQKGQLHFSPFFDPPAKLIFGHIGSLLFLNSMIQTLSLSSKFNETWHFKMY